VRKLSDDNADVRVVACGGDGTVKWVISELTMVGCLRVPIGVIPFGTGNDFSRAMGWGASPPNPLIGPNLSALRARIETIVESEAGPLDTWICEIKVADSGGCFKEVKDGKVVETHKGEKLLAHEMINYFSFGADAQVVFEFEQSRTKSQLGNKLVYVRKGTNQVINRPKTMRKMLKHKGGLTNLRGEPIPYRKRDRVMAFLNIPSYSAGANIWRPGKSVNGTFTRQFVGDKRLESATVNTTVDVALHIASAKWSHMGIFRVAQAEGYSVNFAQHRVRKKPTKTYLQVDGEAILAEQLESVTIRHGFQVLVLRSPKAIAKSFPDDTAAPDSILLQPSMDDSLSAGSDDLISDPTDAEVAEAVEVVEDAEDAADEIIANAEEEALIIEAEHTREAAVAIQGAFRKHVSMSPKSP